MWMADPHVISALREKRAIVAGLVEKLERKLEQHRADLTHIDGVLRLFQPDRDPGEIKPKRTYRRTRYFARNELARLCMDALRDAPGLITTDEIAAQVIAAKGFEAAVSTPERKCISGPEQNCITAGCRRPPREGFCCATNRMRSRIASRENVTESSGHSLTQRAPVASLLSLEPSSSFPYSM